MQAQNVLKVILLLVFLIGCSPAETGFAGTEWELVTVNGKDLIAGTVITLNISDEYLGGEMGCNGYGGTPDSGKYIAESDGNFALGSPFAVTVQLCTEPEGIMEQEAAYIESLMNVVNFSIVENILEFKNEAGETILVFQSK